METSHSQQALETIGVRGKGVWKFSGQTLLSVQVQVALILLMKNKFLYSEKCHGKLCFQGKRKLLKSPWMMKNISIQWNISGETSFSGQAHVAQKSWMIKNISMQWKMQGNSVFQGKRKLLKDPEW